MESQASPRVLIASPPALNWDVLSHLVHLSNLEAMPLPMALSARSGHSLDVDDSHGAERNRTKQSRFFTISRKGRTVEDLAHQLDDPKTRSSGQSPISREQEDDAARLPKYLSNPFAETLHAQIKSAQEAAAAARRRKSNDVRRKSSVFNAAFQAALVSLSNVEEEPREFRPSTFTRHGLSFAKMRKLEGQYAERERQVRKMLDAQASDAQQEGGTAAAQPQQLLPAPPSTQPPQLALSFRSTKVLEGTLCQITSPPPPRTPRGHIALLERAEHCLHAPRARDKTSTAPGPATVAVEEVDWQGSALHDTHVPQPSPRHTDGVSELPTAIALVVPLAPSLPDVSPTQIFVTHPPRLPSPRGLAHPMFRRGRVTRVQPTQGTARPEEVVSDERKSAKSYRPNPLRELGSEIRLSSPQ